MIKQEEDTTIMEGTTFDLFAESMTLLNTFKNKFGKDLFFKMFDDAFNDRKSAETARMWIDKFMRE